MTDQPPFSAHWLVEPFSPDVRDSIRRLQASGDVQALAIMPDVHLAAEVCVGIVLATSEVIYPSAVGADIGCGMVAVAFDATSDLLADERHAARMLHELYRNVPCLKHRVAGRQLHALPQILHEIKLSDTRLAKLVTRDGVWQLGTLGRGNHFLEFQADSQQRVWLMLHTGSRGMGQAIASHHLRVARKGRQGLAWLDSGESSGQAYLNDVAWARAYARENRLAILTAVESIVARYFRTSIDWATVIENDHNHVQGEQHADASWWIHRKGAQQAALGQRVLIPGSMGTASFHATGRGHAQALESCSHGAGRRLSRGAARMRISAHQVRAQLHTVWYDRRQTDSLRDEAPSAYKNIYEVIRAQRDLVRVDRVLRPLLSYKGAR